MTSRKTLLIQHSHGATEPVQSHLHTVTEGRGHLREDFTQGGSTLTMHRLH